MPKQHLREDVVRLSDGISAPAKEIYVLEDFQAPDGTNLDLRTPPVAPVGSIWNDVSGNATFPSGDIQGNKGRIQDIGDGVVRGYVTNSAKSAGVIRLRFKGNGTTPAWPAIVFRHSGADTLVGWKVRVDAESDVVLLLDPGNSVIISKAFVSGPNDEVALEAFFSVRRIVFQVYNLSTGAEASGEYKLAASSQTNTFVGFLTRTAFGAGLDDRFSDFEFASS